MDEPTAPEISDDAKRIAALLVANAAKALARLAFEDEPSGYTAALRREAP